MGQAKPVDEVYRGHRIRIHREDCLGGWSMLYVSITRESDGYECECFPTEDTSTPRQYLHYMKQRVDAELAEDDPWQEKAHEFA